MPQYTLYAYKSSNEDRACGCTRHTYSSEFVCLENLTEEEFLKELYDIFNYKVDYYEYGFEEIIAFKHEGVYLKKLFQVSDFKYFELNFKGTKTYKKYMEYVDEVNKKEAEEIARQAQEEVEDEKAVMASIEDWEASRERELYERLKQKFGE